MVFFLSLSLHLIKGAGSVCFLVRWKVQTCVGSGSFKSAWLHEFGSATVGHLQIYEVHFDLTPISHSVCVFLFAILRRLSTYFWWNSNDLICNAITNCPLKHFATNAAGTKQNASIHNIIFYSECHQNTPEMLNCFATEMKRTTNRFRNTQSKIIN